MTANELNYVQNLIDYRFKNIELLKQAFTRRSYSAEHGGNDNEVLEFIGDKALDFVIVKHLTEKHGSVSDESGQYESPLTEGELTDRKAALVQKKTLAKRIDYLGFADLLIMGQGDIETGADGKQSVREDLFEAILGAVALDSKWDLNALSHVVMIMLDPDTELLDDEHVRNYVGELQNWALLKEGALPLYHSEPYSTKWFYNQPRCITSNDIRYVTTGTHMCYLRLPNHEEVYLGFGFFEKEARMDVAKLALEHIERNGWGFSVRDEIPDPSLEESISQLEILARRGYFDLPEYAFSESHDRNGNPVWDVECKIPGTDKKTTARSSSKKEAKKEAAYAMLTAVLKEED